MWEPRPLTTLRASTACYRDSFTFYVFIRAKSSIFCDITLCSPLKVNWHFGGTCLHLQGPRISQARTHREAGSKQNRLSTHYTTLYRRIQGTSWLPPWVLFAWISDIRDSGKFIILVFCWTFSIDWFIFNVHNISEIGLVSVMRWVGGEDPTRLRRAYFKCAQWLTRAKFSKYHAC
jgi:hypothetical protein